MIKEKKVLKQEDCDYLIEEILKLEESVRTLNNYIYYELFGGPREGEDKVKKANLDVPSCMGDVCATINRSEGGKEIGLEACVSWLKNTICGLSAKEGNGIDPPPDPPGGDG